MLQATLKRGRKKGGTPRWSGVCNVASRLNVSPVQLIRSLEAVRGGNATDQQRQLVARAVAVQPSLNPANPFVENMKDLRASVTDFKKLMVQLERLGFDDPRRAHLEAEVKKHISAILRELLVALFTWSQLIDDKKAAIRGNFESACRGQFRSVESCQKALSAVKTDFEIDFDDARYSSASPWNPGDAATPEQIIAEAEKFLAHVQDHARRLSLNIE